MAEINANIEDVVQVLTDRAAGLLRENAILMAQLSSARQIIADMETSTQPEATGKV